MDGKIHTTGHSVLFIPQFSSVLLGSASNPNSILLSPRNSVQKYFNRKSHLYMSSRYRVERTNKGLNLKPVLISIAALILSPFSAFASPNLSNHPRPAQSTQQLQQYSPGNTQHEHAFDSISTTPGFILNIPLPWFNGNTGQNVQQTSKYNPPPSPNSLFSKAQIDSDPELQLLSKHYRESLREHDIQRRLKQSAPYKTERYSKFISDVKNKNIERVTLSSDSKRLLAQLKNGEFYRVPYLLPDPDLIPILNKQKIDISVIPMRQKSASESFKSTGISIVLSLLTIVILRRILLGGIKPGESGGLGGSPFDFGKTEARVSMINETGVTFDQVAGISGAKQELEEVVEFLKNSERFTALGAKIPRGVLLDGPPGCGKTLLARAVAGEAGVPFFSVSGSEFIEMFVGVGASRVRDLFRQAKKNAPCIAFIDEIDAIGKQRSSRESGNEEREQTLNQLLTEMDGFEGNSGIIVLAATNRAEVLDKALLRPGRFDRRIQISLPDFQSRCQILEVHANGKPFSDDVSLENIARRTPGFSGAALQNLLNESAIYAARRDKSVISSDEIEDALERLTVGLQKANTVLSPYRKRLVAFHEAGHAVLGALMPLYDTVQRISIVPRGGAGGLTFFAPDESRLESGLYSKQYLNAQLVVALGGRVAEELVFGIGEVTTGASNDFEQVTRVARQMVMRFGFSEKFRSISVDNPGSFNASNPISLETMRIVDEEVSKLVSTAYSNAKSILTQNRQLLDALAQLLMDQETVSAQELEQLIAQHDIKGFIYR